MRKVECLQLAMTTAAASLNASAGQRAEYLGDGAKTNDYDRTDAEMQTVSSRQCDLNDRPPSSQPCTTGIECAPITLGSGNIDIAHNVDNGDALGVSESADDRDKVANEDGEEEDDDEEEAEIAENGSDIARAFEEPRESEPDVREEVDEPIVEVNSWISYYISLAHLPSHSLRLSALT